MEREEMFSENHFINDKKTKNKTYVWNAPSVLEISFCWKEKALDVSGWIKSIFENVALLVKC